MPIIQRIEVRCDLMGFWLFYFMENEVEVWKDIKGYEGIYRISNLGNVFSVRIGRNLKKSYDTKGYVLSNLCVGAVVKKHKVHHLVIRAFIDENFTTIALQCDHINRIKDDNRVENLKIVNNRENNTNKPRVGLIGVKRYNGLFGTQIYYKGKNYSLGIYNTEIEAHQKYKEALDDINNNIFNPEKFRKKKKL